MSHPDEPISFYIPARNAERTLAECIDAVHRQTRPPDELFIVADPRSTDRTLEVAQASGVRVIPQEGATLGAARNTAIRAAAHRWLACCDSDVFIEPAWLERLSAARSSGAVGIGGRSLERVRNPFDAWRGLHMPHHWGRYPLRNPFMLVSEVLFDRDALLAVGGYRDDLNYYEDSDLCQRLRDAGYDLQYEPSAVGHHQRTDTLESLLTLRWKYSEYRQRHLLDTFAGLLAKLEVNREYALTTLARSLARGKAELASVSVLLFFHHLLADLHSMLSRRPLISERQRHVWVRELNGRIAGAVREILPAFNAHAAVKLQDSAVGGNGEALTLPPAWQRFVSGAVAATRSFCEELRPIEPVLTASARALGDARAACTCDFSPPRPDRLEARLAETPLTPAIDEAFCRWLARHGCEHVDIVGPVLAMESGLLENHRGGNGRPDRLAVVPHLESRVDPLRALHEIGPAFRRAVVCYRPPARFIPGLDVASAGDLAEAAAAAGWAVEHFDTLVGRTRLLLRRVETTRRAG